MIEPNVSIDNEGKVITGGGGAGTNNSPDQTNIASFKSQIGDNGILVIFGNYPNIENTLGSLKGFALGNIEGLKTQYPNFNLIESGPTILAGLPGYKNVYSTTDQFGKFIGTYVWTFKDQKLYMLVNTINADNYNNDLPTAKK